MPEHRNSSINNFLNYCTSILSVAMAKQASCVYFILMKDNTAEKRTKAAFKTKLETVTVLKGSLWCVEQKEFQEFDRRSTATLRSAELKDHSLTCELQDITKLSILEFKLLLALTTCKERDALHSDNKRLVDATHLYDSYKQASNSNSGRDLPKVNVVDEKLSPDTISGRLKFVGEVPGRSGFWFAVEMDPQFRSLGLSNTDGIFDHNALFSCASNSGLLVTANKIFPKDNQSVMPQREDPSLLVKPSPSAAQAFPAASSPSQNTAVVGVMVPGELVRPELELGDRVVWFDEKNDMQLASVRWIGILEDKPTQFTIGVENDKPVGSGTGMYNNRQLFSTRPNHASLIPTVGLLKAEVYYGSKDLVPPAPNSSRDALTPSSLSRPPAWQDSTNCGWDSFSQSQSFLLSPSNTGALTSTEGQGRTTRPLFSASYDQIPSSRPQTSNRQGASVPRTSSLSARRSDVESLQVQMQTHDFGFRRPAIGQSVQEICDVTDVIESGATNDANNLNRASGRDAETRRNDDVRSPVETIRNSGQPRPVEMSDRRDYRVGGSADCSVSEPQAGHAEEGAAMVPRSGGGAGFFLPIALSSAELNTDLDIGSLVEVDIPGYSQVQYGLIRWMGLLRETLKPYVGVELEQENEACTDGSFCNTRLFTCSPKKGFFTLLSRVRRDSRFTENSYFQRRSDSSAFGSMECDELPGVFAHRLFRTKDELLSYIRRHWITAKQVDAPLGRNMGIQGHHNSCYLDATLFSMFAFSSAFDSILHRPMNATDITQYGEVQRALRDGIVNPLRSHMFVRADKVLHLRQWLSQCSSVQGLMDEEKDPDEFLISLLQETMKTEPFIKFSSGQSGFCYQLFVEKDEKIQLPTTQQLLNLSLFQSDIKLLEVPRCLILQMPRFGKDFQMYRRIVPSLTLDITNMLEHDPQPCCFCGKLASAECRSCCTEFGKGFDRAYFCETCIQMSHSATMRVSHHPKKLTVYPECRDFYTRPDAPEIRSEVMELFAVICIKTSHYVTFTKCGNDLDSPWVFFDSMADRIGQQHGHNVPQLEVCLELPAFLKEDNRVEIMKCPDDKQLPELMRRLICDGYICMYQSATMEPYR